MNASRQKRGVSFRTTVAVVTALVAYPLSFGPAIWLTARGYFRQPTVQAIYMPVLWSAAQAETLEDVFIWWGSLGVPHDKSVDVLFETDDALHVFQFTPTGEGVPL